MKFRWFPFAAIPVMAGGLLFAQAPAPAPAPAPGAHQNWRANRAERMAQFLNLTDAQKEQAKAVFQDARQQAASTHQQLKQTRQTLVQAIKANDTQQIQKLSSDEGVLMGKLMNIRGDAFAKIYQTLTPDQRAKLDQFLARHKMS